MRPAPLTALLASELERGVSLRPTPPSLGAGPTDPGHLRPEIDVERDLEGYTVPNIAGEPQRHCSWPDYYPLHLSSTGTRCLCPCRIAHPQALQNECQDGTLAVGVAITATYQQTQHLLPLCAPCYAAQVDARWRVKYREEFAWRKGLLPLPGLGILAVLLGWLVPSWPIVEVGGGVLLSAAIVYVTRWRTLRRECSPLP